MNRHQLPLPIRVPDWGMRGRKTNEIKVVSRTVVCCTSGPLAIRICSGRARTEAASQPIQVAAKPGESGWLGDDTGPADLLCGR
jgi:hypothetical protein